MTRDKIWSGFESLRWGHNSCNDTNDGCQCCDNVTPPPTWHIWHWHCSTNDISMLLSSGPITGITCCCVTTASLIIAAMEVIFDRSVNTWTYQDTLNWEHSNMKLNRKETPIYLTDEQSQYNSIVRPKSNSKSLQSPKSLTATGQVGISLWVQGLTNCFASLVRSKRV